MKTEKVKKIVGNLLTKWSVTDEDKIEFLKELESKFAEPGDADEEDLEPITEETETEQVEEENPTEEVGEEEVEEQEVSEDAEEPAETEPTEEPVEEPLPEEPNVEEQPGEELPPVEQPPVEENPMEQPMGEPQPTAENGNNTLELENKVKELESTNAEMANRLKAIEEVITKLGIVVETEDDQLGLTPTGTPSVQGENDAFAAINKKRIG